MNDRDPIFSFHTSKKTVSITRLQVNPWFERRDFGTIKTLVYEGIGETVPIGFESVGWIGEAKISCSVSAGWITWSATLWFGQDIVRLEATKCDHKQE